MNLKKIIIAASVVLLSVTGIQQADAQHVVRRHHTTVRHSYGHRPVVNHRNSYHRRSRVVHGRRAHGRRTHSATVIVR